MLFQQAASNAIRLAYNALELEQICVSHVHSNIIGFKKQPLVHKSVQLVNSQIIPQISVNLA